MFRFTLTILYAVAEMESELAVERIGEGMARAKLYGTRSGRTVSRPPKVIPANLKQYCPMWKSVDITATDFVMLSRRAACCVVIRAIF